MESAVRQSVWAIYKSTLALDNQVRPLPFTSNNPIPFERKRLTEAQWPPVTLTPGSECHRWGPKCWRRWLGGGPASKTLVQHQTSVFTSVVFIRQLPHSQTTSDKLLLFASPTSTGSLWEISGVHPHVGSLDRALNIAHLMQPNLFARSMGTHIYKYGYWCR